MIRNEVEQNLKDGALSAKSPITIRYRRTYRNESEKLGVAFVLRGITALVLSLELGEELAKSVLAGLGAICDRLCESRGAGREKGEGESELRTEGRKSQHRSMGPPHRVRRAIKFIFVVSTLIYPEALYERLTAWLLATRFVEPVPG